MTYPVPEAYADSDDSDRSGTTFAMKIPAFTADKEVLYAVATEEGAGSFTWPAGWTEAWQVAETGGDHTASGAYKYADGTETGTISVTVAGNKCCGRMWRISGAANPDLEPPLVATDSKGSDTAYAGLLKYTPEGYSNDFLSFTTLHSGEDSRTVGASGYPDNYVGTGNIQSNSGTSDCQMWVAHRDTTGPGEICGVWNPSGTDVAVMSLVIFYPAVRYVPSSTYPYVRSIASQGDIRPSSTTYTMLLPKIIHPGDILLAHIGQSGSTGDNIVWPSGWVELWDRHVGYVTGFNTSTIAHSCAWKRANGSEGRSVLVPEVAAEPACSTVLCIGGAADPLIEPPYYELQPTQAVFGRGPNLDTGAVNDYLWICWILNDNASTPLSINTWDNNYTSRYGVASDTSNPGDDSYMVTQWREHTDDTENPGGFDETNSGVSVGTGVTIAIAPGPFDPGDWWYQGRYNSGRGGYM